MQGPKIAKEQPNHAAHDTNPSLSGRHSTTPHHQRGHQALGLRALLGLPWVMTLAAILRSTSMAAMCSSVRVKCKKEPQSAGSGGARSASTSAGPPNGATPSASAETATAAR